MSTVRHLRHLDEALWAELLRGGGTADERAHLDAECEACEAFLAAREKADALDGRVDALLLYELPRAARAEAGVAAVTPEVAGGRAGVSGVADILAHRVGDEAPLSTSRGPEARPVTPRWSRRRALAGMGAAIAIAAGMVVVLRPTQEERWTGIKGATSGAAPLRIRYLVAATTPDAALERGADGGRYARDRALVFRVEAGGGGYLYLVRVSRNESERVWPAPGRTDAHVDGGAYDFSEGGRPTAYPLRELKGPQRFAAVLAPEPLDQDRLARLARSLPPEMKAVGGAATEEGITVDAIDLVVE